MDHRPRRKSVSQKLLDAIGSERRSTVSSRDANPNPSTSPLLVPATRTRASSMTIAARKARFAADRSATVQAKPRRATPGLSASMFEAPTTAKITKDPTGIFATKPQNVWKSKEFERLGGPSRTMDQKDAFTSSDPRRYFYSQSRSHVKSEPFLYSWDFGNITLETNDPKIKMIHEYLQKRYLERQQVRVSEHLDTMNAGSNLKVTVHIQSSLICKEGTEEVLAGGLPNLLDSLANHSASDKEYIDIFLATHKSFMESTELFDHLVQQFRDPPIPGYGGMNGEERLMYRNLIRVRLVNVFKKWLVNHHYDFEDPALQERMNNMIKDLLNEGQSTMEEIAWGGFLKRSWNCSRYQEMDFGAKLDHAPKMHSATIKKLQKIPLNQLTFLSFSVSEFADQIAMKRQAMCMAVKPYHLLDWALGKEETTNPINQFNSFSSLMQDWVITQVCKQSDLKQRIKCFGNFIKLIYRLLELNEYCGAVDIFVALSGYLVSRLKRTRKGLTTKLEADFKQLEELMSPTGSWRTLRVKMASAKAPYTIPSAIFMRDLVTINENDDFWDPEKQMINFHKRRLLATVIFQFQESIREAYPFTELKIIQDFLSNLQVLPTEQLEDLTRTIEPRDTPKRSLNSKPKS